MISNKLSVFSPIILYFAEIIVIVKGLKCFKATFLNINKVFFFTQTKGSSGDKFGDNLETFTLNTSISVPSTSQTGKPVKFMCNLYQSHLKLPVKPPYGGVSLSARQNGTGEV